MKKNRNIVFLHSYDSLNTEIVALTSALCIYPLLFTSQKFWTKIPTLRHFKNRHSVSLILSDFQNSEGDKKDIFATVRENFFPVLMKGTCRFVCRTNQTFRTRIPRQISVVLDSMTTFID